MASMAEKMNILSRPITHLVNGGLVAWGSPAGGGRYLRDVDSTGLLHMEQRPRDKIPTKKCDELSLDKYEGRPVFDG